MFFRKAAAARAGVPDLRDNFDETKLDAALLAGLPNNEVGMLLNLAVSSEVNRRDTKDLLEAILKTQQEILAELRKQNGNSGAPIVSRAA